MSRSGFVATIIGFVFVCCLVSSCKKDSPTAPKISLTSENVLGKWYCKNIDASSGLTMIFYLDCRSDSIAAIGILNGTLEVELFSVQYTIVKNTFSFVTPPVDTANQNALQIMMADIMDGMIMSDNIYIQDGNLCFVEDEVFTFSRDIPTVSGGTIAGSISVVNGTFGKGCIATVAVDINTNQETGAFQSGEGPYTLWGIPNGSYYVMSLYIPKSHALDWMTNYSVTDFPHKITTVPIAISNGNHVVNTNFVIDLSTGLTKFAADDGRYAVIRTKAFQALSRLLKRK
jgi:hypothetical protein